MSPPSHCVLPPAAAAGDVGAAAAAFPAAAAAAGAAGPAELLRADSDAAERPMPGDEGSESWYSSLARPGLWPRGAQAPSSVRPSLRQAAGRARERGFKE